MSFIGYVNALVIQNGLLRKLPFEIFTQEIISKQDAKTIAEIAGEKESDSKRRFELEEKLRILKEALAVFEEYRK